jgi:hypothetical protein
MARMGIKRQDLLAALLQDFAVEHRYSLTGMTT